MFVFVVLMLKYFGLEKFLISCNLGSNCMGFMTFKIWIVEWVIDDGSFGSLKCLIDTEFESIKMNS